MTLEIKNLRKEYDDVVAVDDVNLRAENDDFLVLLGPSGSGKSTTLRMIAGLETPTSGEVIIDDRDVTGEEPADRNIAMVFQDYALYPHMTVEENMGLSLKVSGYSSEEIDHRVREAAEILGIPELLDRRPSNLSGGQQQRVALGRSMVRDPTVFLLDEPLSNLDAKLRMQMRKELIELHEDVGKAFVYVTHDQVEAMTMATKIAVLHEGELQQIGAPEELYDDPINEFVAEFIGDPGMNLYDCNVADNGSLTELDIQDAFRYPLSDELDSKITAKSANGRNYRIGFRPEDIVFNHDGQFEGEVALVETIGAEILVHLEIGGIEILAETKRDDTVLDDDEVARFDVPEDSIHIFEDGSNILV